MVAVQPLLPRVPPHPPPAPALHRAPRWDPLSSSHICTQDAYSQKGRAALLSIRCYDICFAFPEGFGFRLGFGLGFI